MPSVVFLQTTCKDRIQVIEVRTSHCDGTKTTPRKVCEHVALTEKAWFDALELVPPAKSLRKDEMVYIRKHLKAKAIEATMNLGQGEAAA